MNNILIFKKYLYVSLFLLLSELVVDVLKKEKGKERKIQRLPLHFSPSAWLARIRNYFELCFELFKNMWDWFSVVQ